MVLILLLFFPFFYRCLLFLLPTPYFPFFPPQVSTHISNGNHHSMLWCINLSDEYLLSFYYALDTGDIEIKMMWYLL